MVEPKAVIPGKLAVMSQPSPADVKALAEQGYRAIINTRPDNEEPDQPKAADVRAAAKQAGIHYEHMPVTVGSITQEDAWKFREHSILAQPSVIAHSGTGKRAFILWAAGEVIDAGRSVEELIKLAEDLGLDASELTQVVERISEAD